jgi:gas vesicle protein
MKAAQRLSDEKIDRLTATHYDTRIEMTRSIEKTDNLTEMVKEFSKDMKESYTTLSVKVDNLLHQPADRFEKLKFAAVSTVIASALTYVGAVVLR